MAGTGRVESVPRRTDAVVAAAVLVSALLVGLALGCMTWASISIGGAPPRSMGGGPVVVDVGAIAVTVVLAVLIVATDRWRIGLYVVVTLSSVIVLGLSIAIALDRIAAANSTPAHEWSTTAYGPGSIVGVLAAAGMVAAATVGLIAEMRATGDPSNFCRRV